jgi:hypothetical protein
MLLANYHQNVLAGTSSNSFNAPVSMTDKTDRTPSIKSVKLQAREDQHGFRTGQPSKRDRDIGFADVFLWLENPQEVNTRLVIQRIEIRDALTGKVHLASTRPQEILLGPLENSVNDFHLTNKSGYSGGGKVKAVVIYQIGDRVTLIESSPVEVDRF